MLADQARLLWQAVLGLTAARILQIVLVVLDNLCRDLVMAADHVLLAAALRRRGRRGNAHAGAAAVGDQVRSGRDAAGATRGWVQVAIIAGI
jgi:hypothetical protein